MQVFYYTTYNLKFIRINLEMSEENRSRELGTRAKHTQNINNQNSQIAELSVLGVWKYM